MPGDKVEQGKDVRAQCAGVTGSDENRRCRHV